MFSLMKAHTKAVTMPSTIGKTSLTRKEFLAINTYEQSCDLSKTLILQCYGPAVCNRCARVHLITMPCFV